MSDREDDKPISIEGDAPEADWIEQQERIGDEDDADVFTIGFREADDAVSIESDAPEADWIEQHQPIVQASDDERFLSDDLPEEVVEAGELEQEWIATDDDVEATDNQEIRTAPVARGGGGCNVLAAVAHAVLRLGRDAARHLERSNRRPPG